MFTTLELVNDQTLVTGEDINGGLGQQVVDSSQWAEIKSLVQLNQATEEFDKAVEEFFAPLNAAADKAQAATSRPQDPAAYVVLQEGVEGAQEQPAHVVALTKDSVILRLIEEGQHDRLIWVNGELVVLAVTQVDESPADEVDVPLPFEVVGPQ